jgi:diguanylate cyclase (GGDEF)-like protein
MKTGDFNFLNDKTIYASKSADLSIADKINAMMLSLVYSQTVVGLVASLACSTIILIGLYSTANKTLLAIWYVFSLTIFVLRSLLTKSYQSRAALEENVPFWRNIFICGAFLGGASWGITGSVLFPAVSVDQQIMIILILAGITAGAVPVLSCVVEAAYVFLIAALAPFIMHLLYYHMDVLFDLTALVYLAYLLILARKTHRTMKSAVALQFENHTLLNNLSEAKKQLELINKKLEQVATHDPLTNVANRNLFSSNFSEAIERAKKSKKILALLYMDLDGFKEVNDTYGHHVGDQLLLVIVERLSEFFDLLDHIARLGGDEFAVLLENVENPNEVAKFAKRICNAIAQPVLINHVELRVSASIGIGIYPIDGDDAETLLTIADKAMYHVKGLGGNNFRFNVTLLSD